MADIDVERMDRTVWPWVIGVIALLLLVAAVVSLATHEDAPAAATPAAEVPAPITGG